MSGSGARRRRLLPWLPVLAVMALIFVLSAQSGLKVSSDPAVDKPFRVTGHLLAYAVLAGLSLVALSWGRLPRFQDAAVALVIATVYGLTDELHQSFVPDRMGRLDDVITDVIGAVLGIAVAWVVLTLLVNRRERRQGTGR